MAVLPHANCLALSSGLCADDARDLRRILREKLRGCRRIMPGPHPKVAVYRIMQEADLCAVTGSIPPSSTRPDWADIPIFALGTGQTKWTAWHRGTFLTAIPFPGCGLWPIDAYADAKPGKCYSKRDAVVPTARTAETP
ncbi:MAG: hypothetical protein NT154_15610, partial [Verrucomicrobia bacterium]|nr:hypothetical protein [Verrucomicrobiota bacterium]